ncbi:MAG: YHS domain-containing protein [Deltaproteobacteria bacterium]|nr:YHS domain-containing protein [Deltaproteobacteria bacterium]
MNLSAKNNKTIIDPVCGMGVVPNGKEVITNIDGKTYYFCSEGCRRSFTDNPEKFLKPGPAKKKGLWGRYLERLEKAHGGRAMKCH